jgi:hypothetical protein
MTEHAQKLNDRLREMPLEKPSSVWKQITSFVVGGLTEVGYADDTDLLLVVSSQGRGLFDCLTGERIAREYESPDAEVNWYNPVRLVALGIGVLAEQQIRLAGLHGGGMSRFTFDGWSLEIAAPNYPIESVFLSPPLKSVFVESFAEGCVKIAEDYEVRACGFSSTGNSFIVAWSHTLDIYAR